MTLGLGPISRTHGISYDLFMKTRTVLVVDDSSAMRETLQVVLNSRGIQTEFASNAAQAYGILGGLAPDLVLLDIRMPGMNGLQFLHEMHTHPQWSSLPVIVISGQDDPGTQYQAWKLGARKFLIKARVSTASLVRSICAEISRAA